MPLIPAQKSADDAAQKIRQIVTRVGRNATGALQQINRIIKNHGRSNILTALGDDADDLTAFHDDIRGLAVKYVGTVLDEMPEDPPEEPAEEPAEPPADPLPPEEAPVDPAPEEPTE